MKIMIDIPEDVYTRLFDNGIQDNEIAVDDVCEMARAIRLGTPLPKQEDILDEIKAEFISLYPKNYAGEPELGGSSCEFSLNKTLAIIDKYKADGSEKE